MSSNSSATLALKPARSLRPAQILYIEDEADLCDLVSAYLKKEGFSVQCKSDGYSGLQAIRKSMPDLVLLDVMLPGIDGWEVCRQIKRDARLSEIPVLFLSARSQTSEKLSGIRLGAEDFITKPFSLAELTARIRLAMSRSASKAAPLGEVTVSGGGATLHCREETLKVSTTFQPLASKEKELLCLLMTHPKRAFTSVQLAACLDVFDGPADEAECSKILAKLSEKLSRLKGAPSVEKHAGGWSLTPTGT